MSSNYSSDENSQENLNTNDKYASTGESEFSRESTIPFDQDEVLSERHYNFGTLENVGKPRIRSREPHSEPLAESFKGKGPRNFVINDKGLWEDVCEALYRSSAVDASDIEVFVSKKIVTLKGWVDTREQKDSATDLIYNVRGVEDVYNELHLKSEKSSTGSSRFGLMNNITGMN